MNTLQNIIDCKIGTNTTIHSFVNLYGCIIGDDCLIGAFVEIQKGVKIGNRVRIQSHSFLCEGVTIADNVFIGHHVVFTNDKFPKVSPSTQGSEEERGWELLPTVVKKGASIGSNVTILPGVTIGEGALVGAGSVVTKHVPGSTVVAGNPAKSLTKKA